MNDNKWWFAFASVIFRMLFVACILGFAVSWVMSQSPLGSMFAFWVIGNWLYSSSEKLERQVMKKA